MNNRWGSINERFYDKMWRKTVRGMEVCEIPVRLPMNDTVMETVECMWVDIWCILDYVTRQQKCISLAWVGQLVSA